MKTRFLNVMIGFLLPAAVACSTSQSATRPTTPAVTTISQARQDYLAGMEALREADYPKATDLLQRVARAPSYIVYAPLAKLRLADAAFFQDRFEEAMEGYRSFIETNQGDPNLHYAAFMLARSAVKAQPSQFFMDPPADRRDQRRIRSSMAALMDFVERFPDSPYVDQALAMLHESVTTVVSFEMEVARFYMTRDKPVGAAQRLQRLLRDIPRATSFENVHLALAEALIASSAFDEARVLCQQYSDRFASGSRQEKMAHLCSEAQAHAPVVQ